MAKFTQQLYLPIYRWSFKNFGLGSLPRFRSVFSLNFLLIVFLTNVLLFTQLMLKAQWFNITAYSAIIMILGAAFLLLLNHFILLNNRWFSGLNAALERLGGRKRNVWQAVMLINVVVICFFLISIID